MESSIKKSFKCAGILAVIAVVAVGLLALCNAFFPEYQATLDLDMTTILNTISPSGVDDQTALDEGYFIISTEYDLDEINSTYGDKDKSVLALYSGEKGESAGTIFVFTSTTSFSGSMRVVTGIDSQGYIVAMYIESCVDSYYNAGDIVALNELVAGKDSVSVDEIKNTLSSSSSATYTSKGIVYALTLALNVYEEVGANE